MLLPLGCFVVKRIGGTILKHKLKYKPVFQIPVKLNPLN